jgi:hypothetical protein
MPTALRSSGIRPSAGLLGLLVFLLGSVVGSTAAHAEAENSAAVDKVTKANKRAVDEYQNLNFDEARKILKDALDFAGENGLESHPVTARTYVHLGVVVLAGFKQTDEAVKLFRKAIQIQPDIKLDKLLATPEIQEVFDQAVKAETAEKKPPSSGEGITHEPIGKSAQGAPIVVKASVDSGLGAKKVMLSFSADGADEFAEKEMKEDPPGSGNYVGEIPASAAQGGIIDYFIEAQDEDGKVLASKGSNDHTLKIALTGVGGQPAGGVARKKKTTEEPPEEEGPSWYIGLGLGSGFGWTSGVGDVSGQRISPAGFAPSTLGQIAPEFGYFLDKNFLLSLQLRVQFVSGATDFPTNTLECGSDKLCSPSTYALAGFARATFFLAEGDFRPYVVGTAGGGQIRHLATYGSITNCGPRNPTTGDPGNQTCVDTVAAGPVFVGAGGGLLYGLTSSFDLTLGTNLLLGFPTFTMHVDINAGVAMTF